MRTIKVVEAPSENGAGKRGASLGPQAVMLQARQEGFTVLEDLNRVLVPDLNHQFQTNSPFPFARNIDHLTVAQGMLASYVEDVLNDADFPLLFSGDHSNAVGAFSGLKNHDPEQRIGLIWIDAHLDLHNPYTTPSGNIHGMAVHALLHIPETFSALQKNNPDEETLMLWNQLRTLGSHQVEGKVLPQDVVFIGIRDYETEELELAKLLGIRIFYAEEVLKSGIETVLQEAMEHLSACDQWYVSFDVDSLDTSVSTGTGTPVDGGLTLAHASYLFRTLFPHPKTATFEITEINPLLDCTNSMAAAVVRLLREVL
jgi:arginase